MEEVMITNNTKTFRFLPHRGVTLTPGKNRVRKDEWEANLEHPTVKKELASDLIEVSEIEKEEIEATVSGVDEEPSKSTDNPEETVEGKLKQELGLLDEEEKEELPNPSDFSVNDFIDEVLATTKDVDKLKYFISKEKEGKDRTTLLNPLEEKLEGVKDE
ncbi:MAG: hypothetical protein R6V17_07395 [Halanaerobacter sp.]